METSWSSQKTYTEIHSLIDNNNISSDTTWGSSKIKQTIDNIIDDQNQVQSQLKTWSSMNIANFVNDQIQAYFNQKLNSIYPVGSIYISTSSQNPGGNENGIGRFLPGTWQQWGTGRALYGVNDVTGDIMSAPQSYGGSRQFTLTTANLPAHAHTYNKSKLNVSLAGSAAAPSKAAPGKSGKGVNSISLGYESANTGSVGSGTAVTFLPQYITAYFWKRTE